MQEWVPISDHLPAQEKNSYRSKCVVVTDGFQWTIAQYDYRYARWHKDHCPYDLDMGIVTHWMAVVLPKPFQEGGK